MDRFTLNQWLVLGACIFILGLPFARFYFTRVAAESFNQWWVRSERQQLGELGRRLRQSSWLSPQLFAHYLFSVCRLTYPIFWLAAGALLLGDFLGLPWSWRQVPSLPWLLGIMAEVLLLFGLIGVGKACFVEQAAHEEIQGWRVVFHWAMALIYAVLLAQGYARFVKEPEILLVRMMAHGLPLKANESVEQGFARMKNASEEDLDRWIETRNMPRGFSWAWEPRTIPPETLAEMKARFRGQALLPKMVRLPAGQFKMGCDPDVESRFRPDYPNVLKQVSACEYEEIPYHLESVKAFAMGKYELSFDEWDACVADGGCAHWPDDHGHGRGKRPVSEVSWDDAQQYLSWLNRKTGRHYRLPTEVEWEYAARSGRTGSFGTGKCLSRAIANYNGKPQMHSACPEEKPSAGPMPVGRLQENRWGLYDLHGNVAEWVSDCRSANYAPVVKESGCPNDVNGKRRGVRGGSWRDSAEEARFAYRRFLRHDARVEAVGFRLAEGL